MIAFLGMGLLGSNFVRALRRRNLDVQVWSRDAAKAKALAADGAIPCADPAAAARGASRVHLTLVDDAAVDDVLARCKLERGAVVVDHSTTSAAGAAARVAAWRDRGVTYVHAPVFMGPQNARESTGIMLVSGAPDVLAELAPELAPMTGKLLQLGDKPDTAAAFKLMGNAFLMCFTAGIADMLAIGKQLGVPAAAAAQLFDSFNPGTSVGARAKRMVDGNFHDASWELAMARKDARLMIETGAALALIPAIAKRMDDVIAQGHAHDDWTVIAKDAR
jgi:3-hydroxyisobutyrate dehydrogenase|nr:NAD(P)-binding domain-containing protein [Kofleriaceae bacterium]